MQIFIIKAVQLILAFAILVIIHEFGHFLFSRIFGVKVEKFYMFFNPWTSFFKWKPGKYWGFFGKKKYMNPQAEAEDKAQAQYEEDMEAYLKAVEENKKGKLPTFKIPPMPVPPETGDNKSFWRNTEYGIGWLPLGGYCKIAGMIDESMDTNQMAQPAQKWEFRAAPAWQRLLIMIGGVLFNFLLAIVIYAGIVYATGEKYVPLSEAKMGMAYSPAAHQAGFRDGDIPLMADGKKLVNPAEARMEMIQADQVTVLRGNDTVSIDIPEKFMLMLDSEAKEGNSPIAFMTYRIPTKITQVAPGEGADKAGIRIGDRIMAIDSVSTPALTDFLATLPGHDNRTVTLTVLRDNTARTDTLLIPVELSATSKMGVGLEIDPAAFYKSDEIKYTLFSAVPRGMELGTDRMVSYVKSMKMVFTKEGAKSVGGFGTIGSIFPEKWDWIAFWNIAAFLSVALAFMNILPIPALDGGHVLFLLYEIIFRRPPSQKFMEYAQMVGISILLLLLIYANGMDIVRLFK